jgi:integrase
MAKTPKPWFRKGRGWFVTIQGRQHNLGRDKKTAYHEYYRLMRQPAGQRQVSGRSLAAIVDDFLEYVQNNRAAETYRWYRELLQKFILAHKDFRVDDIKPFHVQRWVDAFTHLSKNSRRNHLRAVKRCLRWATSQGYIDRNPLQFLHVPAGEPREVVVSEDEYRQILKFAKPDSLRDLIVTTWETGCRPQESLRVEARHVDAVNQRWVIPPSEAKGERITRIVYLTDSAFEITQRLVKEYPTGKLFRNAKGDAWTSDSVNCAVDRLRVRMGKEAMNRQGESVTEAEISAFIPTLKPTRTSQGVIRTKTNAELRCEAKVKLTTKLAMSLAPRYSLYAFRHSFATHALERGVDSVTVAILMGHSDPSMLAKVYQHLTQNPKFMLEQAKKAAARD